LLLERLKLRSGYALPAFQPLQKRNPHQRAKTHRYAAFRLPKGVIIGREKGVAFGCDLTKQVSVAERGAFEITERGEKFRQIAN